jgi:hypothetical protein
MAARALFAHLYCRPGEKHGGKRHRQGLRDRQTCFFLEVDFWCSMAMACSCETGREGLFCVWHHASKQSGVRFFGIFLLSASLSLVHLPAYLLHLEHRCQILILANLC